MSPTPEDASYTLLAALRVDLQSFRDEWKRDLEKLVTQPVFEAEMRRRDEQVDGLKASLSRETDARKGFETALAAERAERRQSVRWLVGFLGAPVVGLLTNQIVQAVAR